MEIKDTRMIHSHGSSFDNNNDDEIIEGHLVVSSDYISNKTSSDKQNKVPMLVISESNSNQDNLKMGLTPIIQLRKSQIIQNNGCRCKIFCINENIKRNNICGLNRIIPCLFFCCLCILHDFINLFFIFTKDYLQYIAIAMTCLSGLSLIFIIFGVIFIKDTLCFLSFSLLFLDSNFQIVFNAVLVILSFTRFGIFKPDPRFYISFGAEALTYYGPFTIYKCYLVVKYDKKSKITNIRNSFEEFNRCSNSSYMDYNDNSRKTIDI